MRDGQRARFLGRCGTSPQNRLQGPATQRGRKLRLEPLESRHLLSAFSPLSGTPDGASGSLRDAIAQANASTEADTITLEAGTYNLTVTGDGDTLGDLDLTDTAYKITIFGAGAGQTIIDASALSDRVFDVASGATVEIQGVTITGGSCQSGFGAGINNEGILTLRDSTVSGNTAG